MTNININRNKNRGMTYVELIVVLSIFSIISAVSITNYRIFQSKVDMKKLTNEIAIKIVEAQKLSTSGKLPLIPPSDTWKPSYGIYFNLINTTNTGNKVFYNFIDLDQDKRFSYGTYGCPLSECLEKVNITKGNYISSIKYYIGGIPTNLVDEVHLSFTRPSQTVTFYDKNGIPFPVFDYLEINIASSDNVATSKVKVYPSGRIELN